MQKYASFNIKRVNLYFVDPVITEDDLKNIRPFTEEYTSCFWTNNIHWERHLQIDSGDNWVSSLEKAKYNWMGDWNNDNVQGLAEFISSIISLPQEEIIVWFWSKESGFETTWGVFLRNWINFLFDDESPILICLRTGFAVRFKACGSLYFGVKSNITKLGK